MKTVFFEKLQSFESNSLLCAAVIGVLVFLVPDLRAEKTLSKEGVTNPLKTVTISAPIREVISEISVEEGDEVESGQLLVRLRSEKQAFAVERMTQLIRKAEFDYQAAKRLFEQKVDSRDKAMQAEVELKRLQSDLGIAEAELNERQILSPISGIIVRKYKESGESIAENDPIVQILQVDQLLLLFHLDAVALPGIKMGQKIRVEFPEMPGLGAKEAAVSFIDPSVDSRSGLFRVRLLLDNSGGTIRPGLRVLADFPVEAAIEE